MALLKQLLLSSTFVVACGMFGAHAAEPLMENQRMNDPEYPCEDQLSCIQNQVEYEENKYDPMRFSALRLTTGIQDSLSYNDNIYRSPTGEESDIINRLSPRIRLRSDLDKHEINAMAQLENGIYFDNSENNYTDARANVDGRYDITDLTAIYAGAEYRYDHIDIGSFVDDPDAGASEPTTYHNASSFARLETGHDNWRYALGGAWDYYNYQDTSRRGGGISIQDDRDRNEYTGTAQVGYQAYPQTLVYVRGLYGERIHENEVDSSALFTRDSKEYRGSVGLMDDNRSDGITYDVGVGYLEQDYEAAQLPNVSDVDAYADARWFVTDADALRFRLDRTARDAYIDGVSAYLRTQVRLDYTHDYDEALTLGTGVNYTNNDFETNSAVRNFDREDDIISLRLWGEYEFIEDLGINLYYIYNDRDSNEPRAEFNSNIVGTALSYKY